MHIILGLITVFGVGFAILWRLSIAARATHDIMDAAGEARGIFRRFQWWRKANKDLLRSIDDPKEAAATMMIAMAESDGLITTEEQNIILHLMQTTFQIKDTEAQELFARARWLARDAKNSDLLTFFKKLTPTIKKTCANEQKYELLHMLTQVAEVHGPVSDMDKHMLTLLRQNLDINQLH